MAVAAPEASASCEVGPASAAFAGLASSREGIGGARPGARARPRSRSMEDPRRRLHRLRTEADRPRPTRRRAARECERTSPKPRAHSGRSTLRARPLDGPIRRPDRRPPSPRRPALRVAATRSRPLARRASRAYLRSEAPRPRPRRRCRSRAGFRALPSVYVSFQGGVRSSHLPARSARTEPSSEPTMTVPSLRRVAGASTSPPVLKRHSVRPLASTA